MTEAPKISPENTSTPEIELDESSLSAIRSILTEEVAPAPRSRFGRGKPAPEEPEQKPTRVRRKADALPDLAQPEALDDLQEVAAKPKRGFSLRRKSATPKKAAPKAAPVKAKPAVEPRGDAGAGMMDRIRAYRPTIGHIVLAALALLVFMRPWLVIGLVIFSIIVLVGVFLIAGYDGFWHGVVKASRWYAKRRPSRAAALHDRLDRFAVRWDAVLDRFPEGSVDGLYLPDFAELATAEARHDEIVERRLAGMQGKGA